MSTYPPKRKISVTKIFKAGSSMQNAYNEIYQLFKQNLFRFIAKC